MRYGDDVGMSFQPGSRARCLIMRQDTSAGKTTPCGIAVCSCVVDRRPGRGTRMSLNTALRHKRRARHSSSNANDGQSTRKNDAPTALSAHGLRQSSAVPAFTKPIQKALIHSLEPAPASFTFTRWLRSLPRHPEARELLDGTVVQSPLRK